MQILCSDYINICVLIIRLKWVFFMTDCRSVQCNHLSNRLEINKKNVFSTQYGIVFKYDCNTMNTVPGKLSEETGYTFDAICPVFKATVLIYIIYY